MRYLLALGFILFSWAFYSQQIEYSAENITISNYVEGTLLQPVNQDKNILVIIIPDSGPTDRNGNQNFQNNNVLKKLAEALVLNGISSFRFDKRSVKQIRKGKIDLKTTIDDFVVDAKTILQHFSKKDSYEKIFLLGHGQGSLVGLLAIDEQVDGFISVAGAGRSLDNLLIEEVEKTAPSLLDETKRIVGLLAEGKTTNQYPKALESMFHIDLQPFMISWIQHNPTDLIEPLSIPSLIINGTKDLQVSVEETKRFAQSNSKAKLSIIEDMNHVLVLISGDDLENSKSYNEAQRKIAKELINVIVNFVTTNY